MNKKDISISAILFGSILTIFILYISFTFEPPLRQIHKYFQVYLGGEKNWITFF